MKNRFHDSCRSRCRVFISYRFDSNSDFARLIRDALLKRGFSKDDVFLAVDDIPGGHYPLTLQERLNQATDVIVVISEGSLARCQDETDWVRIEVCTAIQLEKTIIPVVKLGYNWLAQPLPKDMSVLKEFIDVKVRDENFEADMDRLVKKLKTRPRRWTARKLLAALALLIFAFAAYFFWLENGQKTPGEIILGNNVTSVQANSESNKKVFNLMAVYNLSSERHWGTAIIERSGNSLTIKHNRALDGFGWSWTGESLRNPYTIRENEGIKIVGKGCFKLKLEGSESVERRVNLDAGPIIIDHLPIGLVIEKVILDKIMPGDRTEINSMEIVYGLGLHSIDYPDNK